MKKLSLLLAVMLIVLALFGCTKVEKTDAPKDDTPKAVDEKNDTPKENDTQDKEDKSNEFGFITLSKCQRMIQEWGDNGPTIEVNWQNIRLSDEDAEKYPLLSESFEVKNRENDDLALEAKEEYDRLQQEYPSDGMVWYYFSNIEYYVQRADKYIVSILSDFSNYTGGAHGYYTNTGYNYFPETGKEAELTDVITDKDALDKLVYDRLIESNPEEIFEENRESFYETYNEYSYNWTIDYNKLTVYFNPYEVASFAAGIIAVDVWFDENPELFREEFMKAPSSYAIEIPWHVPHTFDMDKTDGRRDTVSVGAYTDDEEYPVGELCISINGNEYVESDMGGMDLTSLVVCIEGKYYVYAEIGKYDGSNYLCIYELKSGKVEKVGQIDVGFKKLWDYENIDYGGYYREIVNNPKSMNLENYFWLIDSKNTAYRRYSANEENAIPKSDETVYNVNEDNYKKVTLRDITVTTPENGKETTLPEGTELTLKYTDCETYIDALSDDGTLYRITVEKRDNITYIDGVDTFECFSDVMPDYGFEELPEYDYDASIDVPYVLYEEVYESNALPSKIELIQLIADENNEEVNTINGEINELYEYYLYNYYYSDEESCDFLAWPTATDRYLNAVVTHIVYPTYGTYGDVTSWVYDKQTGKQYTLEEALADANITREGLLSQFDDAVSQWGGKANALNSLAFRMLENGKPQFLAGVEIEHAPGDTWVYFMTWSDGGIENHDSFPFDPSEVDGDFACGELYCQTLA
ncbi:MAG: DUF3298 and DUF4163 domain-containing protein [Ruminococcaceae bacterium]|nr:DUF3298 and DUF4163 domain-containing protein [Oscillospiraceae bacterium]